MLHRFLYLEEVALSDYVSAAEDGLRVKSARTAVKGGTTGLEADAKFLKAQGSRERSLEENLELKDTAGAQFNRLLQLAAEDEEALGWVELAHLGDLADVGIGAMVSAECEIYVPETVRLLASNGGLADMLDALPALRPAAAMFGEDLEGIPSDDDVGVLKRLVEGLSSDLVMVGEDDESNWKIAGRLVAQHVRDQTMEGFVRVIGKVNQRWPERRWKPLLALPGASLVGRQERRALEATRPGPENEDQFLEGPAVMLDVLAIYR